MGLLGKIAARTLIYSGLGLIVVGCGDLLLSRHRNPDESVAGRVGTYFFPEHFRSGNEQDIFYNYRNIEGLGFCCAPVAGLILAGVGYGIHPVTDKKEPPTHDPKQDQ